MATQKNKYENTVFCHARQAYCQNYFPYTRLSHGYHQCQRLSLMMYSMSYQLYILKFYFEFNCQICMCVAMGKDRIYQ